MIATGNANTLQISSAGRARGSNASQEADYLCQGTPGSADYDVQADLWSGSVTATNYAGVLGRSDASAGTNASTGKAYLGQYDHAALAWSIVKGNNLEWTETGAEIDHGLIQLANVGAG